MAFEEKKDYTPKSTMKPINGAKSMFEGKPKPPKPQDFQKEVAQVQEKKSAYQLEAAKLFSEFIKTMQDKTLPQNRSIFQHEAEKEMLQNMVKLAETINNDPDEPEGMGSMTWIILLFKTCLGNRDRANEMEFALKEMRDKVMPAMRAQISNFEAANKDILQRLDKLTSKD